MKLHLFIVLAATGMSVCAQTNEVPKVKVIGDRVSLRAKPDVNSELLDRAMRGEEMELLGATNGWVAVQAPDSLNFWVAAKYIQNGVVQADKLNVRSGPSPNYNVVAVVNKGDALALRGEFNEWLKIAPPSGSLVWISDEFVERIVPPQPEPAAAPEPEPVAVAAEPVAAPGPVAVAPPPNEDELKPLLLVLDKSREQGLPDEIPGVLRRANPGFYKLVLIVGDMEEPICLVRGNEAQLNGYLNRSMLIKGKKYWAKDVDIPIITPDKIHLDPILSD
ncbi:MAG: SH3 domain-containing protein [Kiritimatiellales bacterium]|nr:SH3 domain-containing protein [Kiritimatiellales bacterium]MCF7863788.1 SH3 domain-containing protein [Kiritimatiellales bacterium]